jgi:hypothetical protein
MLVEGLGVLILLVAAWLGYCELVAASQQSS